MALVRRSRTRSASRDENRIPSPTYSTEEPVEPTLELKFLVGPAEHAVAAASCSCCTPNRCKETRSQSSTIAREPAVLLFCTSLDATHLEEPFLYELQHFEFPEMDREH